MTSYRQIYYHIVFGTKYHMATIPDENCETLYKYIWGLIKNKKYRLYRINGSINHLNLLCDLHPSIALADFVRDIKTSSSLWMKQNNQFCDFSAGARDMGLSQLPTSTETESLNTLKIKKNIIRRKTSLKNIQGFYVSMR